ncbi:MAG: response regulator [Gammaproteobacteria bacterium]|nr:response regulator [Gammaproteobacteria bacterium]
MSESTISTGLHALVVDDSTTIRRLLDLTLQPLGIAVEFADRGEEALSMVRRHRYDIVFLDVMLPGIDGYKVCKQIKGEKNTKGIPVIMLTSKDGAFDKVRGIMAGTDVYLTKPLDRGQLIQALNKCLPNNWSHPVAVNTPHTTAVTGQAGGTKS